MSFYEERATRTKAFSGDRFGMFIHWGIYAIPARGEWVRNNERISNEDYQPYFEEFDPVYYDPIKWAALAKRAGMKYAVMTTKHHDGFCLFDSEFTDYKAPNTPAKRDLIREYVDAFRAEGIKIGFYYSLLDWHHPDYPKYSDSAHPMRENEAFKDEVINFENYVEYLHNQVRELCTNYGKIDILWFDFSYGDMTGEKWEATKLVRMVRALQPGILIDNRLGGDGKAAEPPVWAGDFESPEQIIPAAGVTDVLGRPVPWESCMTLNGNWGYHAGDKNYKTARDVIRMLIECVSKGGNLLLNVGPNARGEIPKESVAVLERVGEWMHGNGAGIYGCGKACLPGANIEKPEWGRYTQRGKFLYAHVYERGASVLRFAGLGGKIKKARLLADGSEVRLTEPWMARGSCQNDAFAELAALPDDIATVIELELG